MNIMKEKHWHLTKDLFHVLCWVSAISIVLYWIYLFTLNEDSTVVDYKKYYHEKPDKHPMISMCIQNPFNTTTFEMMSRTINATSYLEFIKGKYFSKVVASPLLVFMDLTIIWHFLTFKSQIQDIILR